MPLVENKKISQNISLNKAEYINFLELFLKTLEECDEVIHCEYLKGLETLGLTRVFTPNLSNINDVLKKVGWSLTVKKGFIFPGEFVHFQRRKEFPICKDLRNFKPEYSVFPDFIHSVFGHLPLLFWREYRDFIDSWSKKMVATQPTLLDKKIYNLDKKLMNLKTHGCVNILEIKALEEEILYTREKLNKQAAPFSLLDMLYVRSIEFGVIKEGKSNKIVGAAILSSIDEIRALHKKNAVIKPFSIQSLQEHICYTETQKYYFMASSFEEYTEVLSAI